MHLEGHGKYTGEGEAEGTLQEREGSDLNTEQQVGLREET